MRPLQTENDSRLDPAGYHPSAAADLWTMTAAPGAKRETRRGTRFLRRLGRLAAYASVTAHVHATPAIATMLMQGVVL